MSTRASSEERSGWVEFSAVVLFAVAFFRIIEAIAYLSKSHKLNDVSAGYFSDHVWGWGVWDLCIAVLAIFAGLSLLKGGGFGRVIAYIWAVLVFVQGFMVIGIEPWFAVAMMTLAGFVVYGLAMNPEEGEGL
jgi:hypothetical protein